MYALLVVVTDIACMGVFLWMACRATRGVSKPWAD
jgi:hypothetical protein